MVRWNPLLWGYGIMSPAKLRSNLGCSRIISPSCAPVSASPEVSRRAAQRFQELIILTILDGASWMHLHICRCFQEHLRLLLQSLGALGLSPGGSGSVWKFLEALLRSRWVSGRIACGFMTELHSADVVASWMHLHNSRCFQEHLRMLFKSLRAHCLAPGGSGRGQMWLEALVRLPGVAGKIACCFRTNLHFADVNCRNHHLCHHLSLQWTFLEDEVKDLITADSEQWTVIQPEVMRRVYRLPYPTTSIGWIGIVTWIV